MTQCFCLSICLLKVKNLEIQQGLELRGFWFLEKKMFISKTVHHEVV
jgi:hypothetical protein